MHTNLDCLSRAKFIASKFQAREHFVVTETQKASLVDFLQSRSGWLSHSERLQILALSHLSKKPSSLLIDILAMCSEESTWRSQKNSLERLSHCSRTVFPLPQSTRPWPKSRILKSEFTFFSYIISSEFLCHTVIISRVGLPLMLVGDVRDNVACFLLLIWCSSPESSNITAI